MALHKDAANPVFEADPTRYETLDLDRWHEQAWRDPWVFVDPADGAFPVYVTARVNSGPASRRGVIAHAISDNLRDWVALAPITAPGVFGHLEILRPGTLMPWLESGRLQCSPAATT